METKKRWVSAMHIALVRHLVIVVTALCSACTSGDNAPSRTINGVTARFRIHTPSVHFGNTFKVTAVYRNESGHSVVFRYLPPLFDAQIWRGDVEELPCSSPEVPYTEVLLKPGEELRVADELALTRECHKSGKHEVRFYYSLGLLPDKKVAEEFKRTYPVIRGAVAWEERGHAFTISE